MIITSKWLKSKNACPDGLAWAESVIGDGMELEKFITKFDRSDWLIWLLYNSSRCNTLQLVKLACVCARMALKYIPEGEDRPNQAILAAERVVKDNTPDNRAAASDASSASDAYADAYAAAAYASSAAAAAAANAAAAAYASSAAAYAAASAAASDAAYASSSSAAAAYATTHKSQCSAIRAELKKSSFKKIGGLK